MCSLVKSIYSNGYLKNPFVFQRVKLTFFAVNCVHVLCYHILIFDIHMQL